MLVMETSTVLLLFFSAVSAYLIWFTFLARTLKGPRVWPLVGSLPGLIQHCHRLHDWLAENLQATGGTYQTTTCAVPFLARKQEFVTFTCDPKNLEHVLKTRFNNYPKGPTWQAAFHDLLGDGIFNADGNTWLFQRKTAAIEFTMGTIRHSMTRWVSRAIKGRLCPILDSAQSTQNPVDLQDLLLRLTFDNICGFTFGKDPETLAPGLPENDFASAFDQATEATLERLILPEFIWKLRKWLRFGKEASLNQFVFQADQYLCNIIKARRLELLSPNAAHDDLISRFISKGSYTDSFLKNVALSFILAGRDTSSVALCWFFWLITLNPTVEQKILKEICSVLMETRGDDVSQWLVHALQFEELDRLIYLKAALTETLRLYPSVPLDLKHAISDDMLPSGTFVPGGSAIVYSIYSMGRMKSIWGADCMEFLPERWLTEDGKKFEPHSSFEFAAFNGGPRICLGKDLAYLQMKSIAAAILLRHRLTVAPGHRVEQKISLTLFMKYGLQVNLQPRDLTVIADSLKSNGGDANGAGAMG